MSLNNGYKINTDENCVEITPVGEVDIYTSPKFKTEVIDIIENEKKDVVINAEGLEYVDSTGLGVFMSILKKIRENELNLKIINLKPNIYKLFDITGLNKVFNIQ